MKKTMLFIAMLMVMVSLPMTQSYAAETTTPEEEVGRKAEPDANLQKVADATTMPEGYTPHVGDTIIIRKGCGRYETGETMSNWVYYVKHTIRIASHPRHPGAVLIKGINSWVKIDCFALAGAVDKSTAHAKQQEDADRPELHERQSELQQLSESEQKDIAKRAEEINAQSVGTPTEKPVEETPIVEETKQEEEEVAQQEETKEETQTETKPANYDRFTIGLRGGAASLMHNTKNDLGKWNCGYDAMLDLQYAHYWMNKKEHRLGLIIGVAAGYTSSALTSQVNDQYTLTSAAGDIQYTVKADEVKETDGQIQVEIPIMFSLISRQGVYFNIGPKFALPVYSHYNQKISNPNVNAYFVDYGVNVPNEAVTGMVTEENKNTKGKWTASTLNVMLMAELGYEWTLRSGHAISLGAYANYSVYTMYRNDTSAASLVQVGAPGNNQAAPVSILSATDTYNKGLGFFDAGLKLAFHFNFPKVQK